jgi:hypothetical protein
MEVSVSDDNVVNLFPKKEALESNEEQELPLRAHFTHFLNTLDESLGSFSELSAYEKGRLYKTLVDFTHVSLESYLRLKGECF